MLKLLPQPASELLQVFPNQRAVTQGLEFYEIWGILSSITFNNDYFKVDAGIKDSVIPFSILQAILLIRKH